MKASYHMNINLVHLQTIIFLLYCIACALSLISFTKQVSLSVIPVGKWTSHILIKVIVLSLEIRDCIFKLSITLRLSGLKEPMIQIKCYNLLRMAIWLHFILAWVSLVYNEVIYCTKGNINVHIWPNLIPDCLLNNTFLHHFEDRF